MDADPRSSAAVNAIEASRARTVERIETSQERLRRLAVNSIETNASTWIEPLFDDELVGQMARASDEASDRAIEALWKNRAAVRRWAEDTARHTTGTDMRSDVAGGSERAAENAR